MRSWSVQDVAEAIDVKLAAERRARAWCAFYAALAPATGVLVFLACWWWP